MESKKTALFALFVAAGIVASAAFINAHPAQAGQAGAFGMEMHAGWFGGFSSMREMHNAMHGTNLTEDEFGEFHEGMQSYANRFGNASPISAMHGASTLPGLGKPQGMRCGGRGSGGMNGHHQAMHGNGFGMGGMMK